MEPRAKGGSVGSRLRSRWLSVAVCVGMALTLMQGLPVSATLDLELENITAGDAAAGAAFGSAVTRDGPTAVVGSIGANGDEGAAYVFTEESTGWMQQQKLTASDGSPFDHFGSAVALFGDTLAVGAPAVHAGDGAVYMFSRTGDTFSEAEIVTPNSAAQVVAFGATVALFGDTLVVAAPENGTVGRAVYVFERIGASPNEWVQTQKLVPNPNDDPFDSFGEALALGSDTLLITAPADDEVGTAAGAVFVFEYDGADWLQADKLLASDAAAHAEFGESVVLDDDRAVVGADEAESGGVTAGAAYVFERIGGSWTETARLANPDNADHSYFGSSVGLAGDTALVGAPAWNGNAGAVYFFGFTGGSWQWDHKDPGSAGDEKGNAVSIDVSGFVYGAWRADASVGYATIGRVLGAAPGPGTTVIRLAGADRYATAVAISEAMYPSGANVVLIARGDDFPDALAAGPPAGGPFGGPILLTPPGGLPDIVDSEISRLHPANIIILGGPGAVGPTVEFQLLIHVLLGGTLTRLEGADRYGTAVAISQFFYPTGASVAYIARGDAFPDALSGGPLGAMRNGPMLLTQSTVLPATVAAELTRLDPDEIVILGGEGAVSAGVANQLAGYAATITRLAGADRYSTSAAICEEGFATTSGSVFVATGLNFPDALSGGGVAGAHGAPLLLVQTDSIPGSIHSQLDRLDPDTIYILGGEGVVSSGVEAALANY